MLCTGWWMDKGEPDFAREYIGQRSFDGIHALVEAHRIVP